RRPRQLDRRRTPTLSRVHGRVRARRHLFSRALPQESVESVAADELAHGRLLRSSPASRLLERRLLGNSAPIPCTPRTVLPPGSTSCCLLAARLVFRLL